ncbi:MAG: gliding motility-associated C-terminal domain-containing protein, partial [Bacteroidota bacterium]
ISGTPSVVSVASNYVVTATNTGGSTNATVSIAVNNIAPSGLSYTTPNVFTKGTAITVLNPTVGGGEVVSYSVSPSLPIGLSLDTTTGLISGRPTAITAVADYTVTATNAVGSTTAIVSIKVNDVAPVGLIYEASNVFKKDRIVTPLSPSVSGGAVVSYSISPSLLAGLSFDTTSGVISGTPTVVSHEREYVITATNTGGSSSFTLSIKVLDISLKVSQAFTPNGDGANDYWIVPNVVEYPNSIVRVFNANGVQVFHSNNYQNDWNGRNENNNQELPVGSYLYQIDLSGDGTIDAQGWLYIAK